MECGVVFIQAAQAVPMGHDVDIGISGDFPGDEAYRLSRPGQPIW